MLVFPSVARATALALAPALVLAGASFDRAHAQGKLTASYTISVARLPVGKIAWSVDIGADRFGRAAAAKPPASRASR